MIWRISDRADPAAVPLADRHYNRQKIGAPQFVPPGRCVVMTAPEALWVTSWPKAEYTHHAWAGAWVNSTFRREGGSMRSSDMILEAVAATRAVFGEPPPLGMITFVDPAMVRHKRDPGRCYRKAGFRPAKCPTHDTYVEDCAACNSRTKERGLLAFQLFPADMPEASQPLAWQPSFALELREAV